MGIVHKRTNQALELLFKILVANLCAKNSRSAQCHVVQISEIHGNNLVEIIHIGVLLANQKASS